VSYQRKVEDEFFPELLVVNDKPVRKRAKVITAK
jgi:hypothetical protein